MSKRELIKIRLAGLGAIGIGIIGWFLMQDLTVLLTFGILGLALTLMKREIFEG